VREKEKVCGGTSAERESAQAKPAAQTRRLPAKLRGRILGVTSRGR